MPWTILVQLRADGYPILCLRHPTAEGGQATQSKCHWALAARFFAYEPDASAFRLIVSATPVSTIHHHIRHNPHNPVAAERKNVNTSAAGTSTS